MSKPFVVYWLKQPTPYFVERCNAIVARNHLELEVWFNARRESNRSWEVVESDWLFRARYIPTRRLLGRDNRLPLPELRQRRPDLLVQEYDRPYLALGFLAARAAAGRTGFRVLTNFDTWSERTWWREASKHLLFRAVDGAKVGGHDGAKLAQRYGLPDNRTWDVTQSVDVLHFACAAKISSDERHCARHQFGLSGTVLIYVGRLWDGKGVEHLLDAYSALTRSGEDVSLLVVGDGPDEEKYRARAKELARVVFVGFQQRDRLPFFYSLADVMVFPTLGDPNGLVVEEALAAGVPVVSSSAAGNIYRRLPPGGPGLVFPVGDVTALTEAIRSLIVHHDRRKSMASRALETVRHMDPDRYAQDFERFVQGVIDKPRRRTIAAAGVRISGRVLTRCGAKAMAPAAPFVSPGHGPGKSLVRG